MKARELKRLCNNINYIYAMHGDKLCVGNSYCHNLINVDTNTLRVKYALDTFNHGRDALKDNSLEFIWDKLHKLIASGEIHDIINGKDTIENPLPVFIFDNGVIIESVTDKYGWPNLTDDGRLLYDNMSFPTRIEAVEYGIEYCITSIRSLRNVLREKEEEVERVKGLIHNMKTYLNTLREEVL